MEEQTHQGTEFIEGGTLLRALGVAFLASQPGHRFRMSGESAKAVVEGGLDVSTSSRRAPFEFIIIDRSTGLPPTEDQLAKVRALLE